MAGHIASFANYGNAPDDMNYQLTKKNRNPGVTEYLIKLVDVNNKVNYDMIRPVKEFGQSGYMIVYPNHQAMTR